MAKCTYCGREADQPTKNVGGYEILECCTDCEEEINEFKSKWTIKCPICEETRETNESYTRKTIEDEKGFTLDGDDNILHVCETCSVVYWRENLDIN